jgi:hypothetical protein
MPQHKRLVNIMHWPLPERNECRANILQRVNTRIPVQGILDFLVPRGGQKAETRGPEVVTEFRQG